MRLKTLQELRWEVKDCFIVTDDCPKDIPQAIIFTVLGWVTPRVFMGAAQRRLIGGGVLILAYHKVGAAPPDTRDPFLYESATDFERQLSNLASRGIRNVSLGQFPSISQPSVVITFDDGCLDTLASGLPALNRTGFKAIQFLVSDYLGGRNEWDIRKGDVAAPLMNKSQVLEWVAAGHDIGSHSRTHRNLRHLPEQEAREEILGSKKALEDLFGRGIQHFSYPYGSWNEQVRDLVIEAGYLTASTMDFGVCGPACHPHALKRVFPLSSMALVRKSMHRLRRKFATA